MKSGLKESVYVVVTGFRIFSEVLSQNSTMKIKSFWITSILTASLIQH